MPDTAAPQVARVAPGDGESFEPGEDFRVQVQVQDDSAVSHVDLIVNGEQVGRDYEVPYEWSVVDIPAGNYEMLATAADPAGNTGSSAAIVISVVDEQDSGSSGGSSGGSDGGSHADDGDATDDEDDDSEPIETDSGVQQASLGLPRGPQDCRCRADGDRRSDAAMLMALAVIGAGRRRRRVPCTPSGRARQRHRAHPFAGRIASGRAAASRRNRWRA
jgi:hypothetical protein